MFANSTQVSVVEKVSNLVFVDILNETFQYASFDYVIYDGEKKVVRKGYFRAPSVQFRTNNLQEGTYQFEILLNGQVWETAQFCKRQDAFA
jgi:hypothetical protein